MKSYHLTQEQALKLFDEAGGILDIDDKCPLAVSAIDLANTINAALDQVLGEPVAEVEVRKNRILTDTLVQATTSIGDGRHRLYTPKEQV